MFAPGASHMVAALAAAVLAAVIIPGTMRACGQPTVNDCLLRLAFAAVSAMPFCTCPRRAFVPKIITFLLGLPVWIVAGEMVARYGLTLYDQVGRGCGH